MVNSLYVCNNCKTKVPFGNIRYNNDGKRLVCKECYNKIAKTKVQSKETVSKKINPSELVKVICADCRYKFSFNKGSKRRLMCPYCGGDRLMVDDTTPEKLIEEASMAEEGYQNRKKYEKALVN